MEMNVGSFKDRLKKHHPQVTVKCIYPLSSSGNGSVAHVDAKQVAEREKRHKWLITMDAFANFLANMEINLESSGQKLELEEPITVALIDDGVSGLDLSIQSRIVGGRSFCQRDLHENLNESFYVSSGGHGTAMASLISRVCPAVNLYILKLNDYATESGGRQISCQSATKVRCVTLYY